MCLGEGDGTGGGQELPLAPTCGVITYAFTDPRPKRVTGEKVEHRPQASRVLVKTKGQTLETDGFSFCSPRMEEEEYGTTAGEGHLHKRHGGALENSIGQRGERRAQPGHSEDVRVITRRLCLLLIPGHPCLL